MIRDCVTDWLGIVAGLCCPSAPADAMDMLEPFAVHLRASFPPSVFNTASARKVAGEKRYGIVPSWDIMQPVLAQFVDDQGILDAPRLSAPREPEYQRPSPEEVARILAIARHNAERAAELTDDTRPKPRYLTGEALRQARIATGIYPRSLTAKEPSPCVP